MTDNRSLSSHSSHWPTLDDTALYGLAGQFVRAVEPHTEADPVALLTGFLVAFGNAAGRAAGADVGSTRHHLNEFAIVVGSTSRGRKDTARDEVLSFYQRVDSTWTGTRVMSGLSSGEGLIAAVRDPASDEDQAAPTDKRLLVTESEFTSVLKVASREGNIVSEILRQAWDGRALRTMTKTNPLHANAPHVSILASVTMDGLQRHLTASDAANGFANRFLFVVTKRSRLLAQGGKPYAIASAVSPLVQPVHRALDWVRQPRTFTRDTAAAALWERVYTFLDEYQTGGLVGALTARPEAHVLRLSCLYAALDCSETVTESHLQAAIAVWRYCERSVDVIFERATGDAVSDRLLAALAATPAGLTKTALHRRLGNNASADELNSALVALEESGRVTAEPVTTNSKPARLYHLAPATADAESDPWDELPELRIIRTNELSASCPVGDNSLVRIIRTPSDTEPDPPCIVCGTPARLTAHDGRPVCVACMTRALPAAAPAVADSTPADRWPTRPDSIPATTLRAETGEKRW